MFRLSDSLQEFNTYLTGQRNNYTLSINQPSHQHIFNQSNNLITYNFYKQHHQNENHQQEATCQEEEDRR